MSALWKPSPNYSSGRQGFAPIGIVVHIMQGTLSDTDSWFAAPASSVSAHYGIARTGVLHQYVAEGDTAWHAGRVSQPTWALLEPGVNPNLYTIGIEHEGQSGEPWPDAQYTASAALIAEVAARWSIPLDRQHIVRHADIYSLKPFCPGTGVDLDKLIALARNAAASSTSNNFVTVAGSVTTRTALNIRGAPSTHVPVVKVVPANTTLTTTGWTSSGESVNGNAHWYRDPDGNYFWAGATNSPVPAS